MERDFRRAFDTMPKATKEVELGDYIAKLHLYDTKHDLTGYATVKPVRVYQAGARRAIGWIDKAGNECVRDSYPGATTFELYKRV